MLATCQSCISLKQLSINLSEVWVNLGNKLRTLANAMKMDPVMLDAYQRLSITHLMFISRWNLKITPAPLYVLELVWMSSLLCTWPQLIDFHISFLHLYTSHNSLNLKNRKAILGVSAQDGWWDTVALATSLMSGIKSPQPSRCHVLLWWLMEALLPESLHSISGQQLAWTIP